MKDVSKALAEAVENQCDERCCFDCPEKDKGCEDVCGDVISGDTDKAETCCFYENKGCNI
jgi:hypothetical protein